MTLEYAAEPEDEAADLDEGAKADIEKARLSVVDNLMLQLLANRMSTQTALLGQKYQRISDLYIGGNVIARDRAEGELTNELLLLQEPLLAVWGYVVCCTCWRPRVITPISACRESEVRRGLTTSPWQRPWVKYVRRLRNIKSQ